MGPERMLAEISARTVQLRETTGRAAPKNSRKTRELDVRFVPLAQMPPAIAAPGEDIVATFHAEGAQIYECKPGNEGKLAWVFREPIARLATADRSLRRSPPCRPPAVASIKWISRWCL
jgi:hypothetical protein